MAKSSAANLAIRAGARKPHAPSARRVISVEFEPAEGGMISRTRTRGDDDEDYGPTESKTAIHPTADHAAAHLVTTMASCFEGKGTGNKPAIGKSK